MREKANYRVFLPTLLNTRKTFERIFQRNIGIHKKHFQELYIMADESKKSDKVLLPGFDQKLFLDKKSYKCSICEKQFTLKEYSNKHAQVHEEKFCYKL